MTTLESVGKFYETHSRYPEPYPAKDDAEEKELALWCEKQRSIKATPLDQRGSNHWSLDKEAALKTLPNWHWIRNDSDDAFWSSRLAFLIAKGVPPSKSSNKIEKSLHKWILLQRRLYGKGELKKERCDALSDVAGW